MNTQTDAQIIATIKAAVQLHRDSAENLTTRITALLEPIPGSTKITAGGHTISYRTVYAECSQWGNGAYPCTGSRKAYVIDGDYVMGRPDCSFFDGKNHQYQINTRRWSLREDTSSDDLRTIPVGILREIAKDLPSALLAYAQCCAQAAQENNTLATA
jgi:hypothetical protein